jgi:PAS domain S-box-containing protein
LLKQLGWKTPLASLQEARHGQTLEVEIQLYLQGQYLDEWRRVTLNPILKSSGTVSGVVLFSRNITRSKLAEQERNLSRQRLDRQKRALHMLTKSELLAQGRFAELLQLLLRTAAETLQCERVGLWYFTPEGIRNEQTYARTADTFTTDGLLPYEPHPKYFEALYNELPITADNVFAEAWTSELSDYYRTKNISSMLDVPLLRNGHVFAVLCHEHCGPPRHWHTDEVLFARSLTELLLLAYLAQERETALQELQQSQQELLRSRDEIATERTRIRAIVNSTSDIILAIDPQRRITFFNDAHAELVSHWGIVEYIGMDVSHVIYRDEQEFVLTAIDRALLGETVRFESAYVLPDSRTTRHYSHLLGPILDEHGSIVGVVTFAKDISTRREYEFEIQQKNEELNAQQEELRANLEQLAFMNQHLTETKQELTYALDQLKDAQSQLVLSEKMSALGQLTAGIAHEINNPINYVHGGVEALQENLKLILDVTDRYTELDRLQDAAALHQELENIRAAKEEVYFDAIRKKLPDLVQKIRLGSSRTAEIVRGLRNFSRLDEAELKPADIHEGLESTLLLVQSRLRGRVRILRYYDRSIPPVLCFPGQLNQVFMNLVTNAIDALEEAGRIREGKACLELTTEWQKITTDDEPVDLLHISFRNNGDPIPESIRARVFEPFFTTKGVGKGTGLGLSISYGIVQKHRGTMTVESTPNTTTFTISIPANLKA